MDRPSKSQKKREALSLQDLGAKLLDLTEDELRGIELPENIFDAVMLAKSIKKHEARSRQVQYIGALMRKIDPAPIEEVVRSREEKDREQAELQKRVEAWRSELIKGNDTLAAELCEKLPDEERSRFTGLIEKARTEAMKHNPSPTPSRMLFRFLFAFAADYKL
jgi:ribosome-associated protein